MNMHHNMVIHRFGYTGNGYSTHDMRMAGCGLLIAVLLVGCVTQNGVYLPGDGPQTDRSITGCLQNEILFIKRSEKYCIPRSSQWNR